MIITLDAEKAFDKSDSFMLVLFNPEPNMKDTFSAW